MLQMSLWQRVSVLLTVLVGLTLAMPNGFYTKVERHNDAVALIEAGTPASPELTADVAGWPDFLPSSLVNLGLDLRGGAHLLAEVKVEDVYADRMDGVWLEVRDLLRNERDSIGTIRRQNAPLGELKVKISNPAGMADAIRLTRTIALPVVTLAGAGSTNIEVSGVGDILTVRLSDAERVATDDRTMQQSLEIIRRRVDEVGTREPTIQRQGDRRILIQVPGIGSATELKELIGTTAKLTFHPVIGRTTNANERTTGRQLLVPSIDPQEQGTFYILEQTPVVTGEDLSNAQPSFDQNGFPAVSFSFDSSGGRKFGIFTGANVGAPFAIVLDNEVISAPVIREAILGGSGQISGNFTVEESTNLSVLLRAGALPAEMTFLEERTIGPELGQDSIDAGKVATVVAFVGVLVFMFLSYGMFGLFANVALIVNIGLIFGLLSLIGATLTLPGIAGIVLTVGMAVDANVLVFERIREELRSAKGPARAIELGYEKAMSAILDANVTTFIVAVILFVMGSGPVRGFSITLGLGIMTSVFTALYVTRLLIVFWFERRRPKTLEV